MFVVEPSGSLTSTKCFFPDCATLVQAELFSDRLSPGFMIELTADDEVLASALAETLISDRLSPGLIPVFGFKLSTSHRTILQSD